ncbi:MAG TPA: hypothetical protein VNT27_03100, partial [Propionibacteriaceae bacterium]|nr:hypothetical protein [Propionibacteriaceae bacterium]
MLSTPWTVLERCQQVGIMVAAGVAPTTFAGSLSERSWLDQGLVTGLSTGTQYLVTVTAQDALDLAARGLAGSFVMPSRWSDDRRATVAATVCQGLVVPLGFGVAAWLDRSGPLTSRQALLRQGTWRIGLTGLAGSLLGMGTVATRSLDEAVGAGGRIAAIPLAVPLGLATSLVAEGLRQRSVPASHATDPASTHPLLGLAASAGVVLVVAGAGVGERWAVRQLVVAGRNLVPASDLTWRLAGHAVAVAAMAGGTHALWRMAMGRIEEATSAYDEVVESA